MASRRRLKKTIHYATSEIINEIYFHCLMKNYIVEEHVESLVKEAVELNRELILRANRPDGKNNPQKVKAYYRKIFADWQKAMNIIISKKDKL